MYDPNAAPAEFPKALYIDGAPYDGETGRLAPHQNLLVVNDATEEAAARDAGYSEPTIFPPAHPDPLEAAETDPAGDSTTDGSDPAAIEGQPAGDVIAPEAPAEAETPAS